MKINTDQKGITVNYSRPGFPYFFNGEPIEVPDENAKIILRNKSFYIVEEKEKKASKKA